MLTATYSLVAISAEQKKAQTILEKLRQYIQACVKKLQEIDVPKLEAVFNRLAQFDQYCHSRKVEVYLIPAIRRTTHEVDPLLAELESMSAQAIDILKSAQEHLRQAWEQGVDKIQELYRAMEIYCDNLLTRFTREEQELLPMLERLFSIDEWFTLAAKFLSDDANRKHRRVPPLLPAPIQADPA